MQIGRRKVLSPTLFTKSVGTNTHRNILKSVLAFGGNFSATREKISMWQKKKDAFELDMGREIFCFFSFFISNFCFFWNKRGPYRKHFYYVTNAFIQLIGRRTIIHTLICMSIICMYDWYVYVCMLNRSLRICNAQSMLVENIKITT